MTGSGLGLKRKRKSKKAVSGQTQKRRYFHRGKEERIIDCLKPGLDMFLKRSIQTSVLNSHTLTYKPIEPEDIPANWNLNARLKAISTLI